MIEVLGIVEGREQGPTDAAEGDKGEIVGFDAGFLLMDRRQKFRI